MSYLGRITFAGLALFLAAALNLSADTATNAAPKSYQIRNVKYADLLRPEDANNANGTRLVLHPAEPWKCMTWKMLPADTNTFHLRNHFTSKTFAAASTNDIASVVQVPFGKDASVRPAWRVTKLADGTCEITDSKTGRALTAEKEDGSVKVTLETWREQPEQKWELIETDPATLTM